MWMYIFWIISGILIFFEYLAVVTNETRARQLTVIINKHLLLRLSLSLSRTGRVKLLILIRIVIICHENLINISA